MHLNPKMKKLISSNYFILLKFERLCNKLIKYKGLPYTNRQYVICDIQVIYNYESKLIYSNSILTVPLKLMLGDVMST